MRTTYQSLMRQIQTLQAEAEALRQREVQDVIQRIRSAIDHYGITADDLFSVPSKKQRYSRRQAKATYADGAGNTWGGMGPRPGWLRAHLSQGRTLEEFRV